MPQETAWYVPNRIVHQKLIGDITPEEAIEMGNTNLKYLEEGEAPIHFIIDASQIGSAPLRLTLATESAQWVKHENLGWAVIVGMSGFPKFLLTVIQNTLRFRMGTANSLDEALIWLNKHDETVALDES